MSSENFTFRTDNTNSPSDLTIGFTPNTIPIATDPECHQEKTLAFKAVFGNSKNGENINE